ANAGKANTLRVPPRQILTPICDHRKTKTKRDKEMNSAMLKPLQRGLVIPACPLALTSRRKLDERRQRALFRYYLAAGAGGLAVGVHTTQFAIREPNIGLFRPVLELAAEEMTRFARTLNEPPVRIAGVCGQTSQAVGEASLIR